MKSYSFNVTYDQLQKLLISLINQDKNLIWLREHLLGKQIDKFNNLTPFEDKDLKGRIFSESLELRYQKKDDTYKCLLIGIDLELLLSELNFKFNSIDIKICHSTPKSYFVASLKSIVKGNSIFKDKDAQVLIKEFEFKDEIGGKGFYLCGVK